MQHWISTDIALPSNERRVIVYYVSDDKEYKHMIVGSYNRINDNWTIDENLHDPENIKYWYDFLPNPDITIDD